MWKASVLLRILRGDKMTQLTIIDSNWDLSLNNNENNIILMTALVFK